MPNRDLERFLETLREHIARWVEPPNADDLKWQKKRRKITYARQPRARVLEKVLLSIGGWAVAWPPEGEPALEIIVSRGVLFDGLNPENVALRYLEPHACHLNSARLWKVNPGIKIVTGYALSPQDAVWRQHSWCMYDKGAYAGKIIETCTRFMAYYGFTLNETEAAWFVKANA
jgi:hypothetical protein